MRKFKGFTIVELLIVIIIIAIIGVIALPEFINAQDRGKQSQTVANLRSLMTALALYHADNNEYPDASDIEELQGTLEGDEGDYMNRVPTTDGWNQPLQVDSSGDSYAVWSCGKGEAEDGGCEQDGVEGVISVFSDQIIISNGAFISYPVGFQSD